MPMNFPLFFCHIPKSGGTSLRDALERLYEPWRVMPDAYMLRRNRGQYPPLQATVASVRVSSASIGLMRGHYHLSCARILGDSVKTIVVIRDPVQRALSLLRHQVQHHQTNAEFVRGEIENGRVPHPDNLACRFLAGTLDFEHLDGIDGRHEALLTGRRTDYDSMLPRAVEALERCSYLATTSTLGNLGKRLSSDLGRSVSLGRLNATKGPKLSLPPNWEDVLREHNHLDIELYKRAEQHLALA